jgi:hypothetical protein
MLQIKLIILLAMLSLTTACTSLPRIYSGEDVHGWVIDSETKEPVEGVVVVEVWKLEGGWHSDHTANIHIAETVTDNEGYYMFPDWGPKFTVDGAMSETAPYLIFYKFGYNWVGKLNSVVGNLNPDNSVSEHTGKKIELKKFEGPPSEYYDAVDSVEYILKTSHYRSTFDCMWTKIPRFTAEVVYLREYNSNQRTAYAIKAYPSTYLDNLADSGCENPRKILKDYLK